MGAEIKGFERVKLDRYDEYGIDENLFELAPAGYEDILGTELSDYSKLDTPETEITKNVIIEWVLE